MLEKLNELTERLLTLPDSIAESQKEILLRQQSMTETKNKVDELETELRVSIANQIDENGKKVYTNADSRDAEFSKRRKTVGEFADLDNELSYLDSEIQSYKIEYEKLSNEQRNIRTILNFFSGQANS
jgi:predicted  nucleic acid-binding Zn-ribbon protein